MLAKLFRIVWVFPGASHLSRSASITALRLTLSFAVFGVLFLAIVGIGTRGRHR
jgi:hypothetical protein